MTKNCTHEGCSKTIDDKYMFCYDHFKDREQKPVKSNGWHDDPVVDQLMKINANLGRIAAVLEQRKLSNNDNND